MKIVIVTINKLIWEDRKRKAALSTLIAMIMQMFEMIIVMAVRMKMKKKKKRKRGNTYMTIVCSWSLLVCSWSLLDDVVGLTKKP